MGHPPSSRTRKIYNQRYSSLCVTSSPGLGRSVFLIVEQQIGNEGVRSEEHTSELQSHRDLHSFPTRRSSDLKIYNQRYSSLCVTSSPGLGRSVFLIVEQQIGNEGVGLALPTEGRRLAVAGHEGDVVAE